MHKLNKVFATVVAGSLLFAGTTVLGAAPAMALPQTTPATSTVASTSATEVGVKFTATADVTITGMRLFKSDTNKSTTGSLWDAETDKRLTTALFSATANGWIEASFAKDIEMKAGDTYVVSYYAPKGGYSQTANYFTTAKTEGPITYPVNAGAYTTSVGRIPNTFTTSNYAVDIVYEGQVTLPTTPPTTPPVAVGTPIITAQGSTSSTVSLAWTSSSIPANTEYTVKYGTSSNALANEKKVVASSGNGVTLQNLTANTAYFVKVYPTATPANSVSVTVTTKTGTTNPPTVPPTSIPVKVAIVGDSNSTGYKGKLETGISTGDAYIAQVNGYISFAGGWAKDGSGSLTMANNVAAVPDASVAIIMAGTNDVAKNITEAALEDNLQTISDKVGAPNTLILAIPPFNAVNEQAAEFNVTLARIAARNGWQFFDPWTAHRTADNKWVAAYMREGIHTNKEGYRVMGLAVERYVAKQYAGYDVP